MRELPTTLRTRSENQPSRPTLIVRPAKTATSTVGTSATSAKTQVRRRCRREPADFARRAATARATL